MIHTNQHRTTTKTLSSASDEQRATRHLEGSVVQAQGGQTNGSRRGGHFTVTTDTHSNRQEHHIPEDSMIVMMEGLLSMTYSCEFVKAQKRDKDTWPHDQGCVFW